MLKLVDLQNTVAPSTQYPHGSFRDETGQEVGTELVAAISNDTQGFKEALLQKVNIEADGNVETAQNSQILDAIEVLIESKKDFVVKARDVPNNKVFMTAGQVRNTNDPTSKAVDIPEDGAANINFGTLDNAGYIRHDLVAIDKTNNTVVKIEGIEGNPGVVPDYPDSSIFKMIAEISIVNHDEVKILDDHIHNVANSGYVPGRFDKCLVKGRVNGATGLTEMSENGGTGVTFSVSPIGGGVYDVALLGADAYEEIEVFAQVAENSLGNNSEIALTGAVTAKNSETGFPSNTGFRLKTIFRWEEDYQGQGYHKINTTPLDFYFSVRGIK